MTFVIRVSVVDKTYIKITIAILCGYVEEGEQWVQGLFGLYVELFLC